MGATASTFCSDSASKQEASHPDGDRARRRLAMAERLRTAPGVYASAVRCLLCAVCCALSAVRCLRRRNPEAHVTLPRDIDNPNANPTISRFERKSRDGENREMAPSLNLSNLSNREMVTTPGSKQRRHDNRQSTVIDEIARAPLSLCFFAAGRRGSQGRAEQKGRCRSVPTRR